MKQKTNVGVVVDLMEFSKYGALAQMFVMDALSKHARQVADAPPEAFESMKGGFFNPVAWQGVAREIAEKLESHIGAVNDYGDKQLSSSAELDLGEDDIAGWVSRQIEDGHMALEDIPQLMARYALADPAQMMVEIAERMEMQRNEERCSTPS